MATKTATTLSKGLRLLSTILADQGRSNLVALARRLDMPVPTAHRLAMTLETEGFLERTGNRAYISGPALSGLKTDRSPPQRAALMLRRPLARLARSLQGIAHFAILDDGMVKYLVKETGHDEALFTAEETHLEAYCSALGKILLAALPQAELERYLENGPFVPLTENTITEPGRLKREIETVANTGFALDQREVRDDLFCIAVPVRLDGGGETCAVSLSLLGEIPSERKVRSIRRKLDLIASMT